MGDPHIWHQVCTSIGFRLHAMYQKYFLGYEARHPEDINTQHCRVCGSMDGSMIDCDRWVTSRSQNDSHAPCPLPSHNLD